MSNAATRALHGLFKWAFAIGIVAVGLLALLMAWWIAAIVVVSWLVYAGARRLLSGKRTGVATPGVAATIDGEFQVEHESDSTRSVTTLLPDHDQPHK